MTETPAAVRGYLAAAEREDAEALAACFAEDGTVTDEGRTYTGRAEIAGWRRAVAGQWTYTTEVTAVEPVGPDEYLVSAHIEGDFPGGSADLGFRFVLRDELIADLTIV